MKAMMHKVHDKRDVDYGHYYIMMPDEFSMHVVFSIYTKKKYAKNMFRYLTGKRAASRKKAMYS